MTILSNNPPLASPWSETKLCRKPQHVPNRLTATLQSRSSLRSPQQLLIHQSLLLQQLSLNTSAVLRADRCYVHPAINFCLLIHLSSLAAQFLHHGNILVTFEQIRTHKNKTNLPPSAEGSWLKCWDRLGKHTSSHINLAHESPRGPNCKLLSALGYY